MRVNINTAKFLEDVERSDAWAYTTRPQDLEELVNFWKENGKVGSRLELIKHSIGRRLSERDQDRAETENITAEKIYMGAQLIAAATTFMRESTINVPDGTYNEKGICSKKILSDWKEKECLALLSRPIFDEAIYGTVRFHHRSVREFLTAEWIIGLLGKNSSRRRIEQLIFRKRYGEKVVTPAMRPVLTWLVIFDEKIRRQVCEIVPEIIFEGGDPSKLPFETRKEILSSVCEKIAARSCGWSATSYAAIQRFANPDMSEEIKSLLSVHKDSSEIITFLLRMIWQGRIKDLLPEVKAFAVNKDLGERAQIAALRALVEIGRDDDIQVLLKQLLSGKSTIDRQYLSELVGALDSSEESVKMLVEAIERASVNEEYKVDELRYTLEKYVSYLEVDTIELFVNESYELLIQEPLIERRLCNLSEKFSWLISPLAEGVEKLIIHRHPAALGSKVLFILAKIPLLQYEQSADRYTVKEKKFKQVAEWEELNDALFWECVSETRKDIKYQNGTEFRNFWQVSPHGRYWSFDENDFDKIVSYLSKRKKIDEQLIALSLAFQMYVEAGRSQKTRERLKKIVLKNKVLSEALSLLLRPAPQSKEEKAWKQRERGWARNRKLREKKQRENEEKWCMWLKNNLPALSSKKYAPKGLITNAQRYLHDRMREKNDDSGSWTSANWKDLIPEYGNKVAESLKDGLTGYWRIYQPNLMSEKEDKDVTPLGVIFGLSGLSIEVNESASRVDTFSKAELTLACRYAFNELNNFPSWFPLLHEKHPTVVIDCILKEVRWEVYSRKGNKDIYYILSKVVWSGEWLWSDLAEKLLAIVAREPNHVKSLQWILNIVQNSEVITSDNLEKLASRKCKTLKNMNHLSHWFAAWIGVNSKAALPKLEEFLGGILDLDDAKRMAMNVAVNLVGGRTKKTNTRSDYIRPECLRSLILLFHKYIREDEDISRVDGGAYTPELRDNAQEARDSLLAIIKEIRGKETYHALLSIAENIPVEYLRPVCMRYAKERAEQDADISAWTGDQFSDFNMTMEITPCNHEELYFLAVQRLLDLKHDLEDGDNSNAQILVKIEEETKVRNFIGGWLRDRASGRYSIAQEDELADAKRPDLRVQGIGFDAPVPVELKLADNWSASVLLERLENQLCRDYLRDERSDRGAYLLVRRSKKSWVLPNNQRVDFSGLLRALEARWEEIASNFPNVVGIRVVGIDLMKRKK